MSAVLILLGFVPACGPASTSQSRHRGCKPAVAFIGKELRCATAGHTVIAKHTSKGFVLRGLRDKVV